MHFRDERSETRRGKQRFRHQQLFNIRVGFQNQFFQLPVQCAFLLINNVWSLFFFYPRLPIPPAPLPSLHPQLFAGLLSDRYWLLRSTHSGPGGRNIPSCVLRSAEQSGKPTEFWQAPHLTGISRGHLLQSHLLSITLGGLWSCPIFKAILGRMSPNLPLLPSFLSTHCLKSLPTEKFSPPGLARTPIPGTTSLPGSGSQLLPQLGEAF